MLIKDNLPAASFDNYLILPGYSDLESRSQADTSWEIKGHNFKVPIFSANMDTITGEKMARKMGDLGGLGIIHRYQPIQEGYQEISSGWRADRKDPLALSVGSILNDQERIDWCVDNNHCDIICVDIAHGHSVHMEKTLKYIRDKGFTGLVVAGNVVTPEATTALLEWGADLVKVGVGPGSVCTTRVKTGCGYPQLAAVAACSEAGPIIADGGIKTPGDAAKALAAGTKAVMIGGLLAGTDCVPGWNQAIQKDREALAKQNNCDPEDVDMTVILNTHGGPSIEYRGMASLAARQSFTGTKANNAEGVSLRVKCGPPGSTEQVINDIVEGVRSAMSYAGARNLTEFYTKSKLVRVDSSVVLENRPHYTS